MSGRRSPRCAIGARRLVELAEKYGVETFENAMSSFMDFGEEVSLAELAKLPKGTFELSEEQDDGRIFNVKITISDTEFEVDLRENPDQSNNPVNTSRDGVMVSRADDLQVADRSPIRRPMRARSGRSGF